MKLKALVAISSVLACGAVTSAYAASSNSLLSAGGTYVSLGMGIGGITASDSSYFAPGNNTSSNSGFSYRFAVGQLYAANNRLLLGAELGYSNYANTNRQEAIGTDNFTNKSTAQGIDLLMNLTYLLTNKLSVSVEPGMQYAMEKSVNTFDQSGLPLESVSRQSNAFVPEVVLGTNFQIMSETPLFVGAYYQKVFGNNTNDASKSIKDRDQVGVSLTYSFGAN